MSGKFAWALVTFLLIVIVILAWILFATPKPAEAPTVASSTPTQGGATTPPAGPLHERVVVSMPVAGATVGEKFIVMGEAPGNWYFEAVFPVQVRDANNNKVGQGQAQAQSDWMTTAQVQFRADITVNGYTGPATLVLLRDNPSGLPENDDSFEVPIVIQ